MIELISGKTQNLAIIGYPIEHTMSPVMQAAALEAAGLEYNYIALSVPPGRLVPALDGLRALYFRGWNVTIPHKSTIMQFLDAIDFDAKLIGAVNTVVNDGGCLTGYNTDAYGFHMSLVNAGFKIDGKRAIVLGAGGAARAVLWALCQRRASSVTIGVRNPKKAAALVDDFANFSRIDVFDWNDDQFKARLDDADILVNTTPLGMSPNVDEMPPVDLSLLPTGAVVYDLVYNPSKTKLLASAEELGLRTINGEAMLAHQGVESFRLFTGVESDAKVMLEAIRQAFNE